MKTPHIPLRSPDLSLGASKNSCRPPKAGESPFISKRGRTWHDGDIRDFLTPQKTSFKCIEKAKAKYKKEPVIREAKEVKGKALPDGSFKMTTRKNGKFGPPLVFSASLMAKLNA